MRISIFFQLQREELLRLFPQSFLLRVLGFSGGRQYRFALTWAING